MPGYYECMGCGHANIPMPSEDLLCIFCLAESAKASLPKTKEVKVDGLLASVFPDGVKLEDKD